MSSRDVGEIRRMCRIPRAAVETAYERAMVEVVAVRSLSDIAELRLWIFLSNLEAYN